MSIIKSNVNKLVYPKITVVTDDNYLREGLISMSSQLREFIPPSGVCFFDIESIRSIREMRKVMRRVRKDESIVGILGDGLISRQFTAFSPLHIGMPLRTMAGAMLTVKYEDCCKNSWMLALDAISSLELLTPRQRGVFRLVQAGLPIYSISSLMQMSRKTSYGHTRSIGQRFNIKNLSELYYFAQLV